MRRILILADDLSGAADCGIACTKAGLNTVVSLGEVSEDLVAEAVSIDADTRRLDAVAASARMDHLVRTYASEPTTLLFKKIDSTLRGHVGSELAAVLRAYRASAGGRVAVMAPAFPAAGRTTVRGLHYVHGSPLHDTEIWRNQKMTGEAYIPDMLEVAGLRTAHFSLDIIQSSAAELHHALTEAAQINDVLLCDAETDDDLFSIAEASVKLGPEVFWVGSAGLAHLLPYAAGIARTGTTCDKHVPHIEGPTLFVIGSMSRSSKRQVEVLADSPGICSITVPPAVLLAGATNDTWHSFAKTLQNAIEHGQDVILIPGPELKIDFAHRPRLSLALAQMTAPLRDQIGALVASGGETARMVLESWGVTTLRLVRELETGLPISVVETSNIPPFTIITKAGDFGGPETLLHCRESIHAMRGKHP
jgi:D-threonate/D-erythronate kinase